MQEQATHEPRTLGTSRDPLGHRTVFYGVCACGMGTTNSANMESVRSKLKRHADGDDRGMVKSTRTEVA